MHAYTQVLDELDRLKRSEDIELAAAARRANAILAEAASAGEPWLLLQEESVPTRTHHPNPSPSSHHQPSPSAITLSHQPSALSLTLSPHLSPSTLTSHPHPSPLTSHPSPLTLTPHLSPLTLTLTLTLTLLVPLAG